MQNAANLFLVRKKKPKNKEFAAPLHYGRGSK